MYVGPQQMLHITESTGGSCMADPLACTTDPRVAITNLVLRDVEIRGGFTPNVFLCDAASPCEGVVLERVTRTGWPMVWFWASPRALHYSSFSHL